MAEAKTHYPVIDGQIAAYLRNNNMSQAELAAKMGMSEVSFSWKRRGIKDWWLSEVVELCSLLNLSLDEAVSESSKSSAPVSPKPSPLDRLANLKKARL